MGTVAAPGAGAGARESMGLNIELTCGYDTATLAIRLQNLRNEFP